MNKKKLIIILLVIVLVIGISYAFIKLFDFEGSEEETYRNNIEVTEEEIHELYSYLLKDNSLEFEAMHSNHYSSNSNISNYVKKSMIYQYLLNYDPSSLETLTQEELTAALPNSTNYTPLYKISTTKIEETLYILFGPDATINDGDFDYSRSIKGSWQGDYYYIYDTLDQSETNFIEFKNMTRYSVSESEVIIYDYYLKCDTITNRCYNDERRASINNSITYSSNFDINNYLNDLVTYEHVFKYNTDTREFYWYSSQVA